MKINKICIVTGTRADIGIYNPLIEKLNNNSNFQVEILATGMHYSKNNGYTIDWLKNTYNIPISEINTNLENGTLKNMAKTTGLLIYEMSNFFSSNTFDLVILLGDRTEMFAAAYVCSNLNILIAHFHGGEQSSSVDNNLRHAISKLSHMHFTATEKSKNNLIKMGENPKYTFNVGSIRVNEIVNSIDKIKNRNLSEIFSKYNISLDTKDYYIMLFHPVTNNLSEIQFIKNIVNYISEKSNILWIRPNNDAGNDNINKIIEDYSNNLKINTISNLSPDDYLSILYYSQGLIGNSSSGIIESPALKKYSLNFGTRQLNRERTKYTIDIEDFNPEIIDKFLNCSQQVNHQSENNIYFKNNTLDLIIDILSGEFPKSKLLIKELHNYE